MHSTWAQSNLQTHETDPNESEDPHPRRKEKSRSVRGPLQRLQQDLHQKDEEDAEGQTWGTQAGSEKGGPKEWHCCSCPCMSPIMQLIGMVPQ